MNEAFGIDPPGSPWGINFGGGLNSTALLLECHRRGLLPDWVLFADTGSERPETYVAVEKVKGWCAKVGFPFETVRWIRKDGSFEGIHDNCLRSGYLPSKAYGLAGCTFKWKIQPMQRWRKEHGLTKTVVAIGYDAGERARVEKAKARACDDAERNSDETMWYPLVAWGMTRKDCQRIVTAAGFDVVKSSCFMCPNMRPQEWRDLKSGHPELYAIAEKIESQAKEKGNADTASIFRSWNKDQVCFCFMDNSTTEEETV
jgi:3'-phosphoadenosine 5'-phosphosulfate sulfotransferase (PAPS reductase)/FAD synthetase